MADTNNSTSGPTDEEAIARVLKGETQAFELLVERYKSAVARMVASKVPQDEAPELIHEVFIRAFESLATYRPVKPFKNWLTTIAVRACYDFWRRRYRNREVPLACLSEEQLNWLQTQMRPEGVGELQNSFERFETWQVLDWALGHVAAKDRMALTMVHLEGYSVAETAKFLGWTSASVKVRSFRARLKLRKIIGQALLYKGAGK